MTYVTTYQQQLNELIQKVRAQQDTDAKQGVQPGGKKS